MDIWANRLVGKSSIRRKQIGYFHGRQQRCFVERWGFKSFRVLMVTTSDARIGAMLRTQRHFVPNCPPGFFMYSTPQRLAQHGALGPAWVTIKRDNVSLLDPNCLTPIFINDSAPSAFAAAGLKRPLHDMTRSQA